MSLAPLPPTIQAQSLLQEWEWRTATATLPAYRPALLAHLTELCASLRPATGAGVTIDYEDLLTVLRSAAHFRVGTAATAGSNRAVRAAQALLAAIRESTLACGPAQRALLSPTAQPLHMDELTSIIETIQHSLG